MSCAHAPFLSARHTAAFTAFDTFNKLNVEFQCARPQVALRRLQPTPETLTPLHADALQLCILAKTYAAAVPILDDDILVVDPARTGLVPSDLLLYCLYGGMAATARRQYGRALELYVQVRPAGTCSCDFMSA